MLNEDLLKTFSRSHTSLTSSLISRWPDIEAEERTKEVDLWYQKLSKQIDQFAKQNSIELTPETKGNFIMGTFDNSVNETLGHTEKTDQPKILKQKEKMVARVEQISNVLLNTKTVDVKLSLSPKMIPTKPMQICWGQHGAHFPY